jgi:DNA repair protein RadC
MKPKNRNTRARSSSDSPGDAVHQLNPHRPSTAELLALLVDPPNPRGSALQLAEKILASHNHRLSELTKCPIDAFIQLPGIGRTRADLLAAFAELRSRLQMEKASGKPTIKNSAETLLKAY